MVSGKSFSDVVSETGPAIPPHISKINDVALSIAINWSFGSTPLSKRCDESVCLPYFLALPAITLGLNQALSSNMSLVDSLTADVIPPIIPAIARIFLLSAITRVSSSHVIDVSSRSSIFSFFAYLTSIDPSIFERSNACMGCPSSKSTKFVTSTTGLRSLIPPRLSFSAIHMGVFAPISTSLMILETYRAQPAGSLSVTSTPCSIFGSIDSCGTALISDLLSTLTSLATPIILKQSPLLGVRSTSITLSSRSR